MTPAQHAAARRTTLEQAEHKFAEAMYAKASQQARAADGSRRGDGPMRSGAAGGKPGVTTPSTRTSRK